jgi:CHAT domain-containing protein
VEGEARAVAQRFPAARTLIGPEATRRAVAAALADAPWVHFACHGTGAGRGSGSGPALFLGDGPLSLSDLPRSGPEDAEFAFLSACETARTHGELDDEAITVASALQLAGFRHTIGTLWFISDRSTPEIAARVYEELARAGSAPGALDADGAAVALHRAVLAQRAASPHAVTTWSPFIHLGP